MKLINNRFSIDNALKNDFNNEEYLIKDLWDKDTIKHMRILSKEKNSSLISYFIDDFMNISQIRHKNLLSSYHFGIAETINLKKANTLLYYIISDYIEWPIFDVENIALDFNHRIKLVLEIMNSIDYIHFRGYTYTYLCPLNMYYLSEEGVKLLNLSRIIEKSNSSSYTSESSLFFAPEVIMGSNSSYKVDYYSLGYIMRYLLLKNYNNFDRTYEFYNEFNLNQENKQFLINIMNNLTSLAPEDRNISIRTCINRITSEFNLDYHFDLIKERNQLFLNTKAVGLNDEINDMQRIDEEIISNINTHKGYIIRGNRGIGKSRLIKEISFRFKMKGREIYNIDLSDNDTIGTVNISKFIQKIITYQPESIINKYSEDFARIAPELFEDFVQKPLDLNQNSEKYMMFNRICNFMIDISKEKIVYLIIRNIEKTNETFIELIDYLLNYMNSNCCLILSYNEDSSNPTKRMERINSWVTNDLLKVIECKPLNIKETGLLVKKILGINYVPERFSSIIYKESKGNPGLVEFIIKDLSERGELYLHKDGFWELKNSDLSQVRFPSTYSEIIESQLTRYDQNHLKVIKALSLFNIKITKDFIMDIVKIDMQLLDTILDDLVAESVVEESVSQWGNNYGLLSDELSRKVYRNIEENEKVELHRIASDSMLIEYSGNYYKVIDELVFHLVSAEMTDMALEIIITEAEKIVNKTSSNAIFLWEMAYNIVKNRSELDKLKILDNLTDIFITKGDVEQADFYLDLLSTAAEEDNNIDYKIKYLVYMAESYIRKNQLENLSRIIITLEELSKANNKIEGVLESLILKARLQLSSDNIDYILDITEEALNISNEYNIKAYLGSLYNLNGIIYNYKGNLDMSIESYKKSIEAYEFSLKPYEVIKPINNLGNLYSDNLSVDKSLEYYDQALEIANKYGLTRLSTIFLNNIGEVYYNKLEYMKSIEYLRQASNLAEYSKDVRLIFLSKVNLGLIDLDINKLDMAYNIYTKLNDLNNSNPIYEGETKYKYYNFLGEFYFCFGNLEEAEKCSWIASKYYKEYNTREWLRADSRLIYIRYLKENTLDHESIYSLLDEYSKTDIIHEYQKFILTVAKLSLLNGDGIFASELIKRYRDLGGGDAVNYLYYNSRIIEQLIQNDEDSLIEVERLFINTEIDDFVSVDLDFRLYLGEVYFKQKNYSKALKQYLEALDYLYTITKDIESPDFIYKLVNSKNPNLIKERILEIMKIGFDKDLSYLPAEKIKANNYEEYFDMSQIIDTLSKNEFYDLFYSIDNLYRIKSLDSLLQNLKESYMENLKLILNYIGKETIAKRGFILKINEETGSPEILVSLNTGDTELPNKMILLNSLKSKNPFLYNRSSKDSKNWKFKSILPINITGLICLPITSFDRYNNDILDRRRWETILDNKVLGYVYLETGSALNRFDSDRYDLVDSLTSIIYLNMENERLKRISTNDKVTGAFTRKYFEDRLDSLIEIYKRNEASFSLLMIDIDKFKNINDTYGHLKGDQVLSLMGKVIMDSVRDTDIVGRYGGEEFLVLLNNIIAVDGLQVANNIRKNIEKLKVPGINHPITVSIGLSQYPIHSTFKEELIFKADQAMYYVKEVLGRNNQAMWDPGIDNVSNKVDKLTGLVTGDLMKDSSILLALVDISNLMKENKSYKEKAYDYLGKIIDIVDCQFATIILENDFKLIRKRKEFNFVEDHIINYDLINKVKESKKGECFIDWDKGNSEVKIVENPNWQSIMIIPLIKEESVKGIVYITVPLKEKEFDLKSLNACSVLTNIFTGNI